MLHFLFPLVTWCIFVVFKDESTILHENVPEVHLHRYYQTYLHTELNGYGCNGVRKKWSSCGSTYCTCLTWRVIHTLRRSVLEPLTMPSHTGARVLRKMLGTLNLGRKLGCQIPPPQYSLYLTIGFFFGGGGLLSRRGANKNNWGVWGKGVYVEDSFKAIIPPPPTLLLAKLHMWTQGWLWWN